MSWRSFFAIPILLILVLLQSTFMSYESIGGVTVQLVPIFIFAWAMQKMEAATNALVLAFVGGLLIDGLSSGVMGLSAIALMTAVIVVTPLRHTLPNSRIVLPFALSASAMLIFLLTNLIVMRFLGYPASWQSFTNVPQTILLHALLTLPLYWLFSSVTGIGRRRSEVRI